MAKLHDLFTRQNISADNNITFLIYITRSKHLVGLRKTLLMRFQRQADISINLSLASRCADRFAGHTPSIMHHIELTTDVTIRVKPYPLPFFPQEFVREETAKLLDLGVIEPSTNSYCSPIVLVKKKDGSLQLCIDFR
ncbi:Pol polyprotein [Plakobranchus ocellatus]|uniref:Pol polyprotein n=1 Tax=Plakobranchus ocellatus TaxID=259542 RepID=A0AAV3Z7P5_9GAST|nr:Pol polyprotein [Plakobranchus ocellatus]